tara:strand:- start:173 stop:784 length:612 start_codon:yes stop_codon:yes gene_type:complete
MSNTTIDNFADFELINKDNYFLWSLYDRSGGEKNDEITKEGYAKWTSLTNPNRENITIKEYLKMYPNVSLVPYTTALKLQQKHYEKKYNAYKPYVISRNYYWDKLEVLPPDQWIKNYTCRNHNGIQYRYYFESFKLIECIAENLYNYYGFLRMNNVDNKFIESKERYFEIVLPNQYDPEEIENYCFNHFLKLEGLNKTTSGTK